MSVRKHLTAVSRQSKQSLGDLIAQQCDPSVDARHRLPQSAKYPEALQYLNEIFYALHGTRQRDMNGYPQRLMFSEIKAYVELFELHLEHWELEVITRVDEAWTSQNIIERNRRANDE
ncbi:hypothetical protein QTI05_24125 [Variovorax sp. J22R193]|uniref:phage tail assembly chaperone n=1 Tax=Variovorax fucosicus TaxID=3053517 RepID=UPI00257801B4|nr:hypothetical protein [Variovorax sp. J22R193]MDM0042147.1 hypothetical protein [Variovorax sp. J22R193]